MRKQVIAAVKHFLLHTANLKVAMTGRSLPVGLKDMVGIEKMVLVAAAALDLDIAVSFPDGIYRLLISQQPKLITRKSNLGKTICGEKRDFIEVKKRLAELNDIAREKSCLLVLDDVWNLDDAQAFDLQSSASRILIKTHDRKVADRFRRAQNKI